MTDPFLPPVIVEVIAAVSGVIVSIGVPLIFSKLNKINKLHTTVFGLKEVSTVGGLVEDVQQMEEDVQEIEQKVNTLEEKQEETLEKLEGIEE
jgi:peptidoglycan hydrolase CwlO-like protein